MKVRGVVWAGTRTEHVRDVAGFFERVLGLPLHELEDDFAWFKLPDGSQFELFGADEADHGHFTTGPVPSFHVDDVHEAVEELRRAGCDVWGPWGEPAQGWAHFRAPDGNVYGLSAGAEYRR